MEHEPDEQERERGERIAARLRALDVPTPPRLRDAVAAAVAQAQAAEEAAADGGAAASGPAAGGARAAGAAESGPPAGGDPSAAADPSRRRRLAGRRRRPAVWAGGALAAAAAAALVLALALPGGGGPGSTPGGPPGGAPAAAPSARAVAAVALKPARGPAPQPLAGGRLDVSGDGIPFPDWSAPAAGGWRAIGTRSDRVGGREVTTVAYAGSGGRRVGYAIAAAPALPVAGRYVERGGVPMWVARHDGATTVTWLRDGRTCVLAGRGVDAATLIGLVA